MKKLKLVSALAIPALFLVACGDEKEKETETSSKTDAVTYTAASDVNFRPFEFQDDSGKYVGIDVDLLNAIAEDQEFELKWEHMDFNAIIPALQTKQVDIGIAGMSIKEERKEVVDFTEPYFESGLTLAVKENNTTVNSFEDLKGTTVAVKKGTVGADFAEENKAKYGFQVSVFDNDASIIQEVVNGRATALIHDYPVIGDAIKVNPELGIKLTGEKVTGDNYGIAVLKGTNDELLEKLNTGLKNIKENGKYQEILDKYIEPVEETVAE